MQEINLKAVQASKQNVENIRKAKFVPKTQDDSHVKAFSQTMHQTAPILQKVW